MKCFLCELSKFVKEWKPLVQKVEYNLVPEVKLCKKHLKAFLDRFSSEIVEDVKDGS